MTAPAPWVAAQYAFQSEPPTLPRTMNAYRLFSILRAGGNKPTGRMHPEHHSNRRQHHPVKPDEKAQQKRHEVLFFARN